MQIPCIFEIDPNTNEATGTISPFCSDECRNKAGGESFPGFKKSALGFSHHGDFGYIPHCEECGNEITEIKTHGWVVTCSSNVASKDVIPYGFHLEGDVLFPDSMEEIQQLLGDGFSVTDVTPPKTESTRGKPARCVRVDRLLATPNSPIVIAGAEVIDAVVNIIDEHDEWWDAELKRAAKKDGSDKELSEWLKCAREVKSNQDAQRVLADFISFVDRGLIAWLEDDNDCIENVLFENAAKTIGKSTEETDAIMARILCNLNF